MTIGRNERCPCLSGKKFKFCCLRSDGSVFTQPRRIEVSAASDVRNPKCYASALGGCSLKVTGEHAISKGVLVDLAKTNAGRLKVKGFMWQEGDQQELTPNALTGKVLCTSHNAALSPLDDVGQKFFAGFVDIDAHLGSAVGAAERLVRFFNGNDIERWFLKALCGIVASGNAGYRDGAIEKSAPPLSWLQMLFGLEPLPNRWGLYLRSGVGERVMGQKGFSFAPLVRDARRVYGCITSVHDMNFLLAMDTPRTDNPGDLLEHAIYRPAWFKFTSKKNRKEALLAFSWDRKGDDKGITIGFEKATVP